MTRVDPDRPLRQGVFGPLIGGRGRPAAHSDLVPLDGNRVGLPYETGTRKWRERIVFATVATSALG